MVLSWQPKPFQEFAGKKTMELPEGKLGQLLSFYGEKHSHHFPVWHSSWWSLQPLHQSHVQNNSLHRSQESSYYVRTLHGRGCPCIMGRVWKIRRSRYCWPPYWVFGLCETCQTGKSTARILLLNPIADTHFTIPRRADGWVDLGTAVKVRSSCPRLYIAVDVMINTTVCGEIQTRVLSHHRRTC